MSRWLPGMLVVALAPAAFAKRVPEFTESARIRPFDTTHRQFGHQVAIDGDWALVRVDRQFYPPDLGEDDVDSTVFLYRRSNAGTWVLERQLGEWHQINEWYDPGLAMEEGVAVIAPSAGVFELVGDTWVSQPASGGFQGQDIEISGNRFLSGTQGSYWDGIVHEKLADGTWTMTATLRGEPAELSDNALSPSLDLSGNGAIVANPYSDHPEPSPLIPLARTYRYANGAWRHDGDLRDELGEPEFGWDVAIRGNHAFVNGHTWRGAHVYLRNGPDNWSRIDRLDTVDAFNNRHGGLEHGESFVLQHAFNHERGGEVLNVFRPDESGGYVHAATLSRSDGGPLGGTRDISGRRIIVGPVDAASDEGVFIFELPETLTTPRDSFQDSFEAGNAGSQWAPSAGSSFSIATVNGQRVYRQASIAGEAASFTPMRGVLENQAIQAEITPRSFNGTDRWVGLATRQGDMDNYYYVTLRNGSNRIELKRKVDGVFSTLAAADLSVVPGRTYRVRLESIGPRHMVYVNDERVLLGVDDALAQGVPGLIMYKAASDYDNVIVSPSHLAAIRRADFFSARQTLAVGWTLTGQGNWANASGSSWLSQTSTTTPARALTGSPTDDQILTATLRVRRFNTGSSWAGLLLRYVDDSNYVYAIVRSNNLLSLRELVNGQIRILAETPIPAVQLDRLYTLRVEMVADATRVFLDGVQRLSAGNVGAPSGRVGVMTNRAAADFDDFYAYQP